jgi:hypothetical protein
VRVIAEKAGFAQPIQQPFTGYVSNTKEIVFDWQKGEI